jgi:hypothetical protein
MPVGTLVSVQGQSARIVVDQRTHGPGPIPRNMSLIRFGGQLTTPFELFIVLFVRDN